MNVRHPAPDELLLDYACGAAGPGKSLLVQTHVAMCDVARSRLTLMEQIGGSVLDTIAGERLTKITADSILDALDPDLDVLERPTEVSRPSGPVVIDGVRLPGPLARYADVFADRRSWRTLGWGVEAAELPVSTPESKTQVLRARPGTKILKHTHLGEEAVLLVHGAFYDDGERFALGDVAVSDGATTHAPVIANQDVCVCLAVTEAPIRFVGSLGWLANRFNRF